MSENTENYYKEEERIGLILARVLGLKANKEGRYDIEGGEKTAVGLVRTVERILADEWD